jgi:hypothetical protein
MSLNTLSGPDSRDLSVPRSGRKDPGIGLILSDPVRFSRVLPGYHQGPGMYCLPSGFTLVRICKAITNPFYLLYLLPYFKLPVLLPTWGLKQKN